jgi:hypothetical protein
MRKIFFNKFVKKFLLAVTFLCVLIAILLFILNPKSANAAWYNDSYAYRKYTSFTHNAALTDRRVTLTVDTATLITAGKMQSDCDDTRFTDVNGKELRFQLTAACNNASTTYDVLLPTVVNGLNVTYIYYGNPTAISASVDISGYTSLSPSGGSAALATEEKGPSPILYWSFNDGTGTTSQDTSQNNNDATLTSGPTWRTQEMCVIDKCLKFDGSNDRAGKTYSSDTELDPGTASFTISVWERHPSAISGTDTILSRADGLNGVGYKIYMNSSGNICFGIDDTAGSFPSDSACSTTTYNDSQWHFVQAVKNGTTDITLYIDGNQVAQDASITSSSISGTSSPIYAGIDSDTTSNPWDGFIDEIKIYNYAKTTSQLQADKANTGGTDQTSSSFGSRDPTKSLSNGLVAYWKMDESAANSCTGGVNDSCDSSGNANDGAWSGNTTIATTAKFNSATTFDGTNDNIRAAETTSTDIGGNTSSFTVSAWFKTTTNFGSDTTLVSKSDSSGAYPFELVLTSSEALAFGNYDGTNFSTATTGVSYNDGVWHHALGVRDTVSKKLLLYVDGQLAASANDDSTVATDNNDDLSVGASGVGYIEQDYNGQIDEVRLYNRALSAQEAISLYDWAPGPVGYWKFDEKTGTTINDSSGGGNTGTLVNSPTWAQGKYGGSVLFAGSDQQVDLNDTLDLGADESMTLSYWIYRTSVASDMFIVSKKTTASSGTAGYLIEQWGSGSGGNTCLYVGDGTNQYETCTADNSTTTLNTWEHQTFVFDRNGGTTTSGVYINGKYSEHTPYESGTPSSIGSAVSNLNTLCFAIITSVGGVCGTTGDLSGRLDDVRMYKYARTPKQILEDYNAGHPTVGTPVGSTVGHWSFDEGYGTTANDKSSNSNNLTLSSVSWTNSGKLGKAWIGIGTNWITRADDDDFDFAVGQDFTLSTWIKSTSANNPASTEYIIDKESASAGYALSVNPAGFLTCGIDDDATSFPEVGSSSTTDYYDSTWHHIICSLNSTTKLITLFVDGKQISQTSTSSTAGSLANSDSLAIGDRDATDNGSEFNGGIDEVKIYRAAFTLTDSQIEYNQGKAQVLGALSTESDGVTSSNASAREYCVPGNATTCDAPFAEWKLDENTGSTANDTSTNGNVGTLTGAPTWTRGKIGAGLNLTAASSQYVSAADSSSLDNVGAMTIEAWIKPTATSLDGNYHDILGKGDALSANMEYSLSLIDADTLSFYWANAASYEDWQLSGTSLFTANQWYHIVATRNSALDTVYIYVNGVKYTPTNVGTNVTPVASTDAFAIGRTGAYNGQYFDGAVDNVKLYNYERTPAQAAWSYNRGAPVAYYKMDECSGTTINDSSGNSLIGTLTIDASGTFTSAGACNSGTSSQSWNNGSQGKFNSAAAFDGTDDYISVPHNSKLTQDTSIGFTISAWIYRTGAANVTDRGGIAGKWSPSTGYLLWLATDNTLQFPLGGGPHLSSGVVPDLNTWYHITGVYDGSDNGSNSRIYINGKQLATQADTFPTNDTVPFEIGRYAQASTTNFPGRIDDVRLYNYPLTSLQIVTLYNEASSVRFGS